MVKSKAERLASKKQPLEFLQHRVSIVVAELLSQVFSLINLMNHVNCQSLRCFHNKMAEFQISKFECPWQWMVSLSR